MKKTLFIILLPVILLAQEDNISLNDTVYAFITQGNYFYLQTNKGFIKLEENKAWEDYYRKIYNDSTIVNPNTIISLPQHYIPLISLDIKGNKYFKLKKNIPLKDFVNKIGGNIYILPSVLDSLKKR